MRKTATFVITGMLMLSTLLGILLFNSNNALSAVVINGGDITTDTTWDLANGTYWIEGDVYVKNNVTLTIEAGVEVRFNGSYGLYIENGTLNASGTSLNMIKFTHNTTTAPGAWNGIQINGSTGRAKIKYCNITYGEYGIFLAGSEGIDIEDNIISNNNEGVHLDTFSKGNMISNNTIYENYDGVYLFRSSDNTILNNSISNNSNYGLYLGRSDDNDIQCNNITDNLKGLRLYYPKGNTISNNNISDNSEYGISLYSSTKNNISKNIIFSNDLYGIRLQTNSNDNNITENNVSSNTYGVNLTSSSNNRIYHNIFWNNTEQAYEGISKNFWDDGYPSGGNYWSDFDEPGEGAYDDYQGPGQNGPGSDHIVDKGPPSGGMNPYVIDPDSKDNYPLITSDVTRIFVYLKSPINNSVVKPGTLLDFVVVGDDIANVSYAVNGTPKGNLSAPYDINDTETGTWWDGDVTIDIFVYDTEGNITNFWFNITVDSVKPEITLNSPNDGDLILPGVEINLTVTDDHLFNVTYILDGVSNTTLLTPYNIDTSSWLEGDRTVKVWARDMAGNVNTTTCYFTIDGLRPSITLHPPLMNKSVIKPGTWLRFDIFDLHLNTSAVNYSVNGTGPYNFPEPYNITNTTTMDWQDGNYTIEVNASDVLGNARTRFFEFTIDSIPPTINLTSPQNNSVIKAGEILDFEIVDDNLDTDAVIYYKNLVGPINLPPPDFDIDTTGWPDGLYSIRIEAFDLAGHHNSSFYNFTVLVPPTIILNSPDNNSVIKAGKVINISIIDANLYPIDDNYSDHVNYSKNKASFPFDENFIQPPYHYIITDSWTDGNYTIWVYAEDTAGNTNSTWYNFTVDNTPPSIVLNSPQNESVIPRGTNLDFKVSDAHLISVFVSIDGKPFDPFPPPYDIDTTDPMIWEDGNHTVEITASDEVGHNIAKVYNFTIDTIPPAIALDSPSNNSLIKAGTILNFTISDANLNFSTYSANGIIDQPLDPAGDINTTDWHGEYIVFIYAEDLAGHNTTRWFNFTVDGVSPVITLNSPENNSCRKPGVMLDFDVFDEHPVGVNYSKNNQSYEVLLSPYNIDTSGWEDGIYNITIRAVDSVGNENISEFVFIMDSTRPMIQLHSPLNGTSNELGTPINLSIIDANLDFVNYTVNSGENQTLSSPFDIDTANFPDGDCIIVVYAMDLAGNFNTKWYKFTFNDTTKPTIILNSPQNQSYIPAGTIIDLYIFDVSLRNVNYSLDGKIDVPLEFPYDISTSSWSEGIHTLVVKANDTRNNMNTSTFIFTIDSKKPSILLVSPLNNSVFLPGEVLDFNVTDVNLDSTSYSINDDPPQTFSAPFDIDTLDWEDGSYTISIQATDKAGNENASLFVFIIDSIPPTISLSSPANGSIIKTGTIIDLAVSDANPVIVRYSVNDGLAVTLPSPYDINTSDWEDGSYVIEIYASDPAQNTMHASFNFDLDGTPPEVLNIYASEPYYPYENTMIVFIFSEPMNRTSVILALNITPMINYTVEWSEDGRTLYLRNIKNMQLNQLYTVKLDGPVVDLAGNALVGSPDYDFLAKPETEGGDVGEEEPSVLRFWWLIPILVALLVLALILFLLLMRERKEEPKGPVEELEDMYVKMRAQEDIDAMESILSFEEQFGDRIDEAKLILQKAKDAFEEGNYDAVTVYERTIRDMILESPMEEKPEEEKIEK